MNLSTPRRLRCWILIFLLAASIVGTIVSGVAVAAAVAPKSRDDEAWTDHIRSWCQEAKYKLGIEDRPRSQCCACIPNLKQIDGAKATWALEQRKINSEAPMTTDLFGVNASIRDAPLYPGAGSQAFGPAEQEPRSSMVQPGHTL